MNEFYTSIASMSEGSMFIILIILVVWTTVWKGIALWKSAQLSQKWWFIALLVINTLGIFEIFYIFYISKLHKQTKKTDEETQESEPADNE